VANLGASHKNPKDWFLVMGKVSTQVEALFQPVRGQDTAGQNRIWGAASSVALEELIDYRLQVLFSDKLTVESFRQDGPLLKSVVGTAVRTDLVENLAEIGKWYSAECLSSPNHGGQSKSEQQTLFFEVKKALSTVTGENVGIWQSADPNQQSLGLVIARIIAACVGKPLSQNLRGIIKKSNGVEHFT